MCPLPSGWKGVPLECALGGEGFFWVTAEEQGCWVRGTWTAQLVQMGVDHRTPRSDVWALPAVLDIVSVSNLGQSGGSEIVCNCGPHLHFLDYQRSWNFCMFIFVFPLL